MSKALVERLSSYTLLMALVRLSHREGATSASLTPWAHPGDPDRPARMLAIQNELLRRLNLQRDLSLEAQHTVAHVEVLAEEHPELVETMEHSVSRLKELATQPFGNYPG